MELIYYLLILGVALWRLYEVRLSKQHLKQSQQTSQAQAFPEVIYPFMVAFHTLWLLSCVAEVYFWERPFIPVIGIPMIGIWILTSLGRLWVVGTMKDAWNVQVISNPQQTVVTTGPYRFIRHPNYVIVVLEIFCIPMIHSAYITALLGTIINAWIIRKRLETEEAYLASLPHYQSTMTHRPRFIPTLKIPPFFKNSQ